MAPGAGPSTTLGVDAQRYAQSPNMTGPNGGLMFNSGFGGAAGYDPRNNKTGAPVDYVMQPENEGDEDLLGSDKDV